MTKYCIDDTTLFTENEEELKILLMKVKEESEKAGLKLSIQKTKIITSSPNILCQIVGETMETVRNFVFFFFFFVSKSLQVMTAVMELKNTCSLEEKLWPT